MKKRTASALVSAGLLLSMGVSAPQFAMAQETNEATTQSQQAQANQEVTWNVEFLGKSYTFTKLQDSETLHVTLPAEIDTDFPATITATSSDGETVVLNQVQWNNLRVADVKLGQMQILRESTHYASATNDPKLVTSTVAREVNIMSGTEITVADADHTPFTFNKTSETFTAAVSVKDYQGDTIALSNGQEVAITWGETKTEGENTVRIGEASGVVEAQITDDFGGVWREDQPFTITITDTVSANADTDTPTTPATPDATNPDAPEPSAPDQATQQPADTTAAAAETKNDALANTGSSILVAAAAAVVLAVAGAGCMLLRKKSHN